MGYEFTTSTKVFHPLINGVGRYDPTGIPTAASTYLDDPSKINNFKKADGLNQPMRRHSRIYNISNLDPGRHTVNVTLTPTSDGQGALGVDYITYLAPGDMLVKTGMFFIDDSCQAINYSTGAYPHIPFAAYGNEEFSQTSHFMTAATTATLNFTGKLSLLYIYRSKRLIV